MIKTIKHEEQIIAIIIPSEFKKEGIEFFTPNEFSQQLAYMNRPKDYNIMPHIHNKVERMILFTQEVLFIKSGKIKVDLYSKDKEYIETQILCAGDIILLANGGHGFTMLEDSEMIEVKQGPYAMEEDKIRFRGIEDGK